ncbi:phosphatase PAP2 family protein [Desulfovibrio aerotolerans]|uniref:Phosphatase PAP2 family protein n=1 Tax=Solidesulfovibrio aerotolerans TaxID=295255 RepID=A0A7C9MQJ8_9BACT|nr:phosphatase PAP2 family protein [Solidesulfovibrio aerotolerans]MYL84572.1 phosphatase PAP2 family protein [Solidesulfovibrio aerotolerans]
MDLFFTAITWIGSLYVLLPLSMLLCLLLVLDGKYAQSTFISLSLLLTVASVHVAKLLFRRPRPSSEGLIVAMPPDWSFPSAHTAQATSFFLSLTFVIFQFLPPTWATLFSVLNLFLVFCVGYSRIYLQVHYVSDVLAGFILAMIVVAGLYYVILFRK